MKLTRKERLCAVGQHTPARPHCVHHQHGILGERGEGKAKPKAQLKLPRSKLVPRPRAKTAPCAAASLREGWVGGRPVKGADLSPTFVTREAWPMSPLSVRAAPCPAFIQTQTRTMPTPKLKTRLSASYDRPWNRFTVASRTATPPMHLAPISRPGKTSARATATME